MKKKISYQNLRDLALSLSITKNTLLTLGLIKTYHALDSATKEIGWEMAEIMEGNHPLVEIDTVSNEDKDENTGTDTGTN